MTRVLLIGDSICMGYSAGLGYRPFVEDLLAVRGIRTSSMFCSDSGALLKKLDELTHADPFDVIHVNCGLHDLKRDRQTGAYTTPAEAYRINIDSLLEHLQGACSRVVWATITPVCDAWHQRHKAFDRFERDVQDYNTISRECAATRGIAINDLHDVVSRYGMERAHHQDGVHFNKLGSRLLGDAVFTAITS